MNYDRNLAAPGRQSTQRGNTGRRDSSANDPNKGRGQPLDALIWSSDYTHPRLPMSQESLRQGAASSAQSEASRDVSHDDPSVGRENVSTFIQQLSIQDDVPPVKSNGGSHRLTVEAISEQNSRQARRGNARLDTSVPSPKDSDYQRPKASGQKLYNPKTNGFSTFSDRPAASSNWRREDSASPNWRAQYSKEGRMPTRKRGVGKIPQLQRKEFGIYEPKRSRNASGSALWNDSDDNGRHEQVVDDDRFANVSFDRRDMSSKLSTSALQERMRVLYESLSSIESACISEDEALSKQTKQGSSYDLDGQQHEWRRLVELHESLAQAHFDFFELSGHANATEATRKIPETYSLPMRLWRHGVYPLLEVLRKALPDSKEHMLAFIYSSYSTISMLSESETLTRHVWWERLGDLSRYRSLIEQDVADRDIWKNAAVNWYHAASMVHPDAGHLYHDLANVCDDGDHLTELFLYCKSVSAVHPCYQMAGLADLINPCLENSTDPDCFLDSFLLVHALLFSQSDIEEFGQISHDCLLRLDQEGMDWERYGAVTACCNIVSLFQYGHRGAFLKLFPSQLEYSRDGKRDNLALPLDPSVLSILDVLPPTYQSDERLVLPSIKKSKQRKTKHLKHDSGSVRRLFETASTFAFSMFKRSLMITNLESLHHVYVWLVFLEYASRQRGMLRLFETFVAWDRLVDFLNRILPWTAEDDGPGDVLRPLPDSWRVRGTIWAQKSTSDINFRDYSMLDREEVYSQFTGSLKRLGTSVVKLAKTFAFTGQHLHFDEVTDTFAFDQKSEERMLRKTSKPNSTPAGGIPNEQMVKQILPSHGVTLILDAEIFTQDIGNLERAIGDGQYDVVLPLAVATEIKIRCSTDPEVARRYQILEKLVMERKVRLMTARGTFLSDLSLQSEETESMSDVQKRKARIHTRIIDVASFLLKKSAISSTQKEKTDCGGLAKVFVVTNDRHLRIQAASRQILSSSIYNLQLHIQNNSK